jgi:LysM repeat protein
MADQLFFGRLVPALTMCWALTAAPSVAQDADGWITVRPGDTLFSLARAHGVTVDNLRAWNDLSDSGIRSGMRLRVRPEGQAGEVGQEQPESDPDDDAPEVVQVLPGGRVAVIVRPSETLADLADRYDMSEDSLRAWNPGLPLPIEEGMAVVVPGKEVVRTHTVRRGETLYTIARQYNASVDRIQALNPGLYASSIRVGQKLAIPATDVPVQGATPLTDAGSFALRDYPEGMAGRLLPEGFELDPAAFQVSHPRVPAGSLVLIQAASGIHAFAEVVENAVERQPMFVEGSAALVEALGIRMGEPVSFRLVR